MLGIILISIVFLLFFAFSIITFFSGVHGLILYLLIIGTIIMGLVVIKILWNCKKYGTEKVFGAFKRKKVEDNRSIFIDSLKSQMNSQVFFSKENPNVFLIINQNGVILYYFLTMVGTIYGEDSKWYCKNGREKVEIMDPNLILSEEENRISRLLNIPVLSYFVLDSQTSLLNLSAKFPILKVLNAPYYLCKTDMKMRLTEENIFILLNTVNQSGFYEAIKK